MPAAGPDFGASSRHLHRRLVRLGRMWVPAWHVDVENRAPGRRVDAPDIALQPYHGLLDDAQAETGAALFTRVGCIDDRKPIEDMRLEVVGNSRTLIVHGNPKVVGMRHDRNSDLATSRRKFHGVG